MHKVIARSRRGIIGFVVTMAVGLAIGAATIFVSSEVAKGLKEDRPPIPQIPQAPESAREVDQAFQAYQVAQRRFEDARQSGAADVAERQAAFLAARKRLERAILMTTPGVSQMDLPPLTIPVPPPPTVPSGAVVAPRPDPFGDHPVTLDRGTLTETVAPPPESVTPDANLPSSVAVPAQSAGVPSVKPASTGTPADTAGGFEYVRVRQGDSLWQICQSYYGDGGMWQHVLKYQVPSIAATPNLIFPGQLIALPRQAIRAPAAPPDTPRPTQTAAGSVSPPAPAAPGDESWQEKFQKDLLISDHCLTNSGSMTVAQIQAFLDKKGSILAKPYRGSKPAQMIYDAARKHGINPQVLLTRLQCEQGLISAKTATQKRLDWALGVGCYDSGNWNQKFKGFDKQIEWAAATYKRHYQDAKARLERGEKVTMSIDGQQITVKNAATYSFYKYCPHLHGNKLFFDVWRGYRKAF